MARAMLAVILIIAAMRPVLARAMMVVVPIVGVLRIRAGLCAVKILIGLALAGAVDRRLDHNLIGVDVGMIGFQIRIDRIIIVLHGLRGRIDASRSFDVVVFIHHPIGVQVDVKGDARGIGGDRRKRGCRRGAATATRVTATMTAACVTAACVTTRAAAMIAACVTAAGAARAAGIAVPAAALTCITLPRIALRFAVILIARIVVPVMPPVIVGAVMPTLVVRAVLPTATKKAGL